MDGHTRTDTHTHTNKRNSKHNISDRLSSRNFRNKTW